MNISFDEFWKLLDKEGKEEYARSAQTSVSQICQIKSGARGLGSNLYFRMLGADERVTEKMLKPYVRIQSRAAKVA